MSEPKMEYMPRPNVPKADGFSFGFCADPVCGVHFIPLIEGTPVLETVLTADQTKKFVEICQQWLYRKATERG